MTSRIWWADIHVRIPVGMTSVLQNTVFYLKKISEAGFGTWYCVERTM